MCFSSKFLNEIIMQVVLFYFHLDLIDKETGSYSPGVEDRSGQHDERSSGLDHQGQCINPQGHLSRSKVTHPRRVLGVRGQGVSYISPSPQHASSDF